jgi:two-component system, cell cycle sensor histidine kinase and response regulator CckA
MTSAVLAGHSPSAQSTEHCTDLNQVIARSESAIVRAIKSGVSVKFALSPNVARVALEVEDLRRILVALCAQACGAIGPGGRLVIETRGINDAQIVPSAAASATPGEARARLIVRAEQHAGAARGAAPRSATPSEVELGIAELQVALESVGGQLELVPVLEHDLAYVAHLPYVSSASSSGRIPVASTSAEVILLVEDEPQVQAVTARILRAFGYSVITAHNERTALAQAEQHGASISLVVSDLVLPGVSGTDLVRRLRQPCEHARVLYMSGYSPEHVGALVEGASFLRKPFTAEELVTMVRDLLASSVH